MKVASSEAELANAKSIRDEEHSVFLAAEKELSETVDSLERASTVVKNNLGLMQGRVAAAKKQLTEDTLMRSTTEEELHEAEASLAETQKVLATDTDYLAELKQSCEAKAVQWTARQKSAAEEMAAIEQAKTTLSEGVPSFLQTGARVQ